MDFSKVKTFSLMQEQMRYLSERQATLSGNIANIDVPGARAQDIRAPDFGGLVKGSQKLAMMATNGQHITGAKGATAGGGAVNSKDSYEIRPTGNNIVLEEQMMKVAQTTAQYQQTTAAYKKMSDMFKLALGTKQ